MRNKYWPPGPVSCLLVRNDPVLCLVGSFSDVSHFNAIFKRNMAPWRGDCALFPWTHFSGFRSWQFACRFGELVRSFSLALGIPQIPASLQASFRPDSPLRFFSVVLSRLENVWRSVFYNNSLHSIYWH